MTPFERADHLIKTSLLATAHDAAAAQGQSQVPDIMDEVDSHYAAFVPVRVDASDKDSTGNEEFRVVEFDGDREGPIDHGPCRNFLEVRGMIRFSCTSWLTPPLGRKDVAKIIKEQFIPFAVTQHFGLVSLGPPA